MRFPRANPSGLRSYWGRAKAPLPSHGFAGLAELGAQSPVFSGPVDLSAGIRSSGSDITELSLIYDSASGKWWDESGNAVDPAEAIDEARNAGVPVYEYGTGTKLSIAGSTVPLRAAQTPSATPTTPSVTPTAKGAPSWFDQSTAILGHQVKNLYLALGAIAGGALLIGAKRGRK